MLKSCSYHRRLVTVRDLNHFQFSFCQLSKLELIDSEQLYVMDEGRMFKLHIKLIASKIFYFFTKGNGG